MSLSLLSSSRDLAPMGTGTAELAGDSRARWGQQAWWAQAHTVSQDSVLARWNPAPFPFLRPWVPEPGTFLGWSGASALPTPLWGAAAELPTLRLCHVPAAALARVVPGSGWTHGESGASPAASQGLHGLGISARIRAGSGSSVAPGQGWMRRAAAPQTPGRGRRPVPPSSPRHAERRQLRLSPP